MRLGIVCSRFNEDITGKMKRAALATAAKLGVRVASIMEVPGAFDTPYAVQLMLQKKNVDAVAVIGAVVKGETDHDVLVTTVAAEQLAGLSLKFKKPVTLGIIGPNTTERQAQARAEGYAERAVEAALALGKMRA